MPLMISQGPVLSTEGQSISSDVNQASFEWRKLMTKSPHLRSALLSMVLLISAGSVSARTGGTFVLTPGSAFQINAVTSAVNPSQILTFLASAIYTGGGDGNQDNDKDNDKGKDKDKDKDKDEHGPSPTPEPSTILSFGAALLIGGGVLFSRRMRRSKK